MFGRSRSWVGGQGRTKNIHSLDHLKYMYHVLTKNTTVTDHNRNLLVETIRSITEILIWGDQNDSSVFDFFLEKNMFAFFLNILRQKSGRYVCVQLLQTLNILFENISHETSLYYLLSNNHVNSIIVHKFDFSDEEIMAYYISFLKTLSLKLNNHTVHFFYNEHTNDFALYTEAIKFFNHPESMVRIAVRTITLNVYKVSLDNQHMLHYIRDKTAVPYFSNLVWFIGSHVIELDKCVQTDEEHKNRGKLSDLVAEHLDHLHYLNDILIINCEFLNDVLTDHLLNRLFLPLYVYSLVSPETSEDRKINSQVSLYLLSQVFLIIHYQNFQISLAIRVFFMLRSLSLQLQGEPETQLPLTRPEDLIKTDDVDLNNSDLIACMVVSKDGGQAQRFLAVDVYQMSLVEPETKRLGWGVVKFAGLLQDMQVSGVEDDSRALNIVIHKPSSNPHAKPLPILQANFIFADHIRCIIAKQRLAKGRIQARRMKMQRIAALLDLPVQPSATEVLGFGQTANASPSGLPFRFYEQSRRAPNDPTANRSVFASVDKVPAFSNHKCFFKTKNLCPCASGVSL
ncbi:protein CLEC16A isoform X4 [Lates japonicus]|uniref:Protein CLEC16A isoform X4 n=1 Tax=Lates japonicus TaxID=270547 RepID=A0AAD3MU97_LATJO|nr:protein CLEC16A isoform X4 [Lates japonicus]